MSSYLEDTYLGGLNEEFSELGADNATMQLTPAPGEDLGVEVVGDMVKLPGGIMMPKKTLWVLLGVLALGALLIYVRRRDRRLDLLEQHLQDNDDE